MDSNLKTISFCFIEQCQMRIPISLWLFLIPFSSIFFIINVKPVSGKCLNDQKSLLLQLKANLKYDSSLSTKLVQWNQSSDCCNWSGVDCDSAGHIIDLDLNGESIAGGIDDASSLFGLRFLQTLNLASNGFTGAFPKKIFQVPTLKSIDLSNNRLLDGSLPEFPQNGALQNLVLSYTQFSGKIPDSIGNLRMLSRIELRGCIFFGPLPSSLEKLTQLTYLDLSINKFTGSIPSFRMSKNLTLLNLHQNGFTGQIPSVHWDGLDKLEFLDLGNNSLSGVIPESLFSRPSLQLLDLSNNGFSGQIGEFKTVSSYQLATLDLGGNKFEGPIPEFIFKLKTLASLSLSGNNFIGNIELSKFAILKDLRSLDLSHNKLSINARSSGSPSSLLPQFVTLLLASCNLQELPDLKNQSRLMTLDLSDNRINGEIPNWIWELGSGILRSLNLSHNKFSSLQEPYHFPSLLDILDLHSNHLQGSIPKPPPRVYILDYSSNNFGPNIPDDIGNSLASTFFLSIADNKLIGVIPQSIGNASQLKLLNFSHNALTGPIPQSVGNLKQLESLDLSVNKLSGRIPVELASLTFLSFLNLSYNQLVGRIPQGSKFQTFTEKSFEGNKGLCGAPLNKSCNAVAEASGTSATALGKGKRNTWDNKHVGRVLTMLRWQDQGRERIRKVYTEKQFVNFRGGMGRVFSRTLMMKSSQLNFIK